MFESSYVIAFLLQLESIFKGSVLYKLLKKLAQYFKNSVICKVLCLGGCTLVREGSVFYGLINKIICGIVAALKNICRLAEGSTVCKWIKFLFGSSMIFNPLNFLMLGIMAMFICPHEIWNNAYALLFAAMLLVYYIFGAAKGKYSYNAGKIWLPFILFVIATFFSVIVSAVMNDSIRVLMFFVTSFILCLVVYGMISDEDKYDKLCAAIYISLVVTGMVAIVQRIIGIDADALLTDLSLNESMPGRAFSTWANPNNYAEFLIIFLPFCFAWALKREGKMKTAAILLMAIPVCALLLTYSRSGWLGFAVTAVTFVAIYNNRLIPLLVLCGILAIPILPDSILDRIMTIGNLQDSSSFYRISIWEGAIDMIGSLWYRGAGLGPETFKIWYTMFAKPGAELAPHTHMLFMEIFAEMGIIGIITLGALIIALVFKTCKTGQRFKNGSMKLYSISAAASMMGILTIGFAEYVWFYPRDMFAFFIAIGMAMAAVRISVKDNK